MMPREGRTRFAVVATAAFTAITVVAPSAEARIDDNGLEVLGELSYVAFGAVGAGVALLVAWPIHKALLRRKHARERARAEMLTGATVRPPATTPPVVRAAAPSAAPPAPRDAAAASWLMKSSDFVHRLHPR